MKRNYIIFVFSLVSLFILGCSKSSTKVNNFTESKSVSGIIGGSDVNDESLIKKSTVAIYDTKTKVLCTGTLIANDLVLTAAHCIGPQPEKMLVYFGKNLNEPDSENLRPVVDARGHFQYDAKRGRNIADIGLIRFHPGPGLPSGYAQANILQDYSGLQKDTRTLVAGYGVKWSWVVSSGAGKLRSVYLKVTDPQFSETEIMMDQSLKRGVCVGDSGGPAFLEIDNQIYFWGIISRGDSIPIPLTPDCFMFSVMTRIDVYKTWIEETSKTLKYP